jgi:uncharacterized protein YjbJ (UPF0337 family)
LPSHEHSKSNHQCEDIYELISKGRVNETEGKVKEVAGKVVGDEKLEAKGKVQRVIGTAQAKFGDVKQDVKDSLKKDA